MEPVQSIDWHHTMGFHFRSILLSFCYTVLCVYHLISGSYTFPKRGDSLLNCVLITVALSLQGLFFVLYPLLYYSYTCICLVLYIQSEHLNQFIRRIRHRCRQQHQLPLKEEMDLMRVWYSRIAYAVHEFDLFGHPIFFVLYFGQLTAMFFKLSSVDAIRKLGIFTVATFFEFAALGLYSLAFIHLLQAGSQLNRSIERPSHYLFEIGMHSTVNEPYTFSDYIRVMEPRFAHKHCQLTFVRIIPIGKEFFLVTGLFIISLGASFGWFGELLPHVIHQMHLLI